MSDWVQERAYARVRRRVPQWRREITTGVGVAALSITSLTFYGYVCRTVWRAMG